MLNLPAIQIRISSLLAHQLSEYLNTEIQIGRTDVGLLNRIILDDVLIKDQQQDTLLRATRLSAKLDIMATLKGKITIKNTQLFGCYINIYQNNPKEKTNLQFIIDALASSDSTQKKDLNLRINSILIRRGEVCYNKRFIAETPGRFNPAHVHIRRLSTNIALKAFTKDSLNFQVKRLSFQEHSGIHLKQMQFRLLANRKQANLTNLKIELPLSTLLIDSLHANYPDSPQFIGWNNWFDGLKAGIDIKESQISLHDLACFAPVLQGIKEPIHLNLHGELKNKNTYFNHIHLFTPQKELDINSRLFLFQIDSKEKRKFYVSSLKLNINQNVIQLLPEELRKQIAGAVPFIERAEFVDFTGDLKGNRHGINAQGKIKTSAGTLSIDGTFNGTRQFKGDIASQKLQVNKILGPESDFGALTFNLRINGSLKNKIPQITAQGVIRNFEYKTYNYQNIKIDGKYSHTGFKGNISMKDPNGSILLSGSINPYLRKPQVNLSIELDKVSPYALKLTPKLAGRAFTTAIEANFSGLQADDLNGTLSIQNFTVQDENEQHHFGNLLLDWQKKDDQTRNIKLQSDFLQAAIEGNFTFKDLVQNIKYSISEYLPGLMKTPEKKKVRDSQITATVHVQNLDVLKYLLDIPITFKQAAYLQASYNSKKDLLQMQLNAPHVLYGSENFKKVNMDYSGSNKFLNGYISLSREMGKSMVNIGLDTDIRDGILYHNLHWNIPNNKSYSGNIALNASFEKTEENQTQTVIDFRPSSIVINDSLWNVHPARIEIKPGYVHINRFLIDQSADRYLSINGMVSDQENDTLVASLKNINLQYVFNMINFHAVEFDGFATGKVYAHDLRQDPTIEAYLNVRDFTFNQAQMGFLNAYATWKKSMKSIYLDAHINDSTNHSTTLVEGTITPGHDAGSGLDLKITADNTNLYFLNQYTAGIFTDLQGRTSGQLRVFGPFGGIDIEGDMLVKEANMKVDILNTRYHMYGNTVTIRPGKIMFKDALIYDQDGGTQTEGHKAIINGTLSHDHFSNLTYDLDIKADQVLAYNQEDFGDELFCGTAIASGSIGINGAPGILNVDIDAWPEEHTLFMYNLSRPDVLTENQFVKFVSPNRKKETPNLLLEYDQREENDDDDNNTATSNMAQPENSNDVRVNFNLHITPRATMKILMDARSGDYISVKGSGNVKATFYNKGKFQMYGTVRVQEGVYKLSLQDVIRKDFVLVPGGNIVFGGDPNEASLNLQAVYSVPSVSLNDLSSGSTFSHNNVRVNCLMNITGKARQPHIGFDFDIPNVNEDEKRMVKSLISTEEEKNMQIIYLLGIGRFYTYDYNNPNQSQSSVAMKSLLSSTLSGQLNEMLSNIIGNNNWNFGTNLSTGEQGWSDMDVEGLLSGRLLNNRLLINGNFGYRDNTNTYKSSNFIGDFDIQWLLTPNGNLSLKAYSETNDRYFTKSSLTTQGIGIQFKKDFRSWKDLFRISRRKRTDILRNDSVPEK